jgi:hypothetical protein
MNNMKRVLAGLALLGLLLSACAPTANLDLPEATLQDFFQALSIGNYESAARLYGGDYAQLRAMNPSFDPNDLSGLWQNGCEVNGLACLPVNRIVAGRQQSEGEYLLTVEFQGSDGGVFSFGPCCGADEDQEAAQTRFDYHVIERQGQYLVLDLPVLVP